jgi:hypothetical protein
LISNQNLVALSGGDGVHGDADLREPIWGGNSDVMLE